MPVIRDNFRTASSLVKKNFRAPSNFKKTQHLDERIRPLHHYNPMFLLSQFRNLLISFQLFGAQCIAHWHQNRKLHYESMLFVDYYIDGSVRRFIHKGMNTVCYEIVN